MLQLSTFRSIISSPPSIKLDGYSRSCSIYVRLGSIPTFQRSLGIHSRISDRSRRASIAHYLLCRALTVTNLKFFRCEDGVSTAVRYAGSISATLQILLQFCQASPMQRRTQNLLESHQLCVSKSLLTVPDQ